MFNVYHCLTIFCCPKRTCFFGTAGRLRKKPPDALGTGGTEAQGQSVERLATHGAWPPPGWDRARCHVAAWKDMEIRNLNSLDVRWCSLSWFRSIGYYMIPGNFHGWCTLMGIITALRKWTNKTIVWEHRTLKSRNDGLMVETLDSTYDFTIAGVSKCVTHITIKHGGIVDKWCLVNDAWLL